MPNMYDDRYAKLNFPDYEYREFPKMAYPGGKPKTNGQGQSEPGVLVHNEEEEAAVIASQAVPVREGDELERLQMVCEVRGIKCDRRWKVDRLREEITAAGHDPEFDPRQ